MKRTGFSVLTALVLLVFGCQQEEKRRYNNSVIAAAHPLASQAGKAMYAKGGNAFDAAIAAAFTLAVVEPSMSGIGGRLQAIYRTASGEIAGVDASTEVPMNYKPTENKYRYGYQTVGIPGVVAGLLKLYEDQASLPLTTLMAPAIRHAEVGFALLPGEARRQQAAAEQLQEFDGSRFHFLKNDSIAYAAGERLIQKDLAAVLRKIATVGKAGFYQGEVAEKIVTDIQTHGGILTVEDLKQYQAKPSRVLRGSYQEHDIHSLYLPSFGAITLQILQILDHLPTTTSEADWAEQLGNVTEWAYTYRQKQKDEDSLQMIISYDQAAAWAEQLSTAKAVAGRLGADTPLAWQAPMGHTTHLTTADQWGNSVALTQTVGPNMGSKVATKGLGFIYAVTLGGYLGKYQPGDRANSHISPTLVTRDGELIAALGAAGGSRIVTAVTQVLSRYLAQGHDLEKALMLPRVYPFQDSIWIENHKGLEGIRAQFDPQRQPVKYIDEYARFGRVHAIGKHPKKAAWIGAADPDWEGTTEYYENE